MANKSGKVATTSTEALKILWEEGFFVSGKKNPAVEERLAKNGYNFDPRDLGMALTRAKYLTRRGNRGKFEFIQKHPFVADRTKD